MKLTPRVRKRTTSIDVILSGSAPSLAARSQESEESPCRRRDPFARLRAGTSLSRRCGTTLETNPLRVTQKPMFLRTLSIHLFSKTARAAARWLILTGLLLGLLLPALATAAALPLTSAPAQDRKSVV